MINALSISSLSYSVSNLNILTGLSLLVPEQSYFAIAGVNGAGKSTLIKLILDLIRPSDISTLEIFGRDNREIASRDQLAYLPEKFDVRKTVTGWQYLEFVASIYGSDLDRKNTLYLCGRLDLDLDYLDSKIGRYSKGMVQKLGLISCFMLDRKLLILDEPLSGLDPKARYHFKQLLHEEREVGRTIFYSTHQLADAEEICDQFGILHEGEMKFVGTPKFCMETFEAATLEEAYMKCISAG